ncbi:MAG TPA: UvrD-helicase domain-containing protein [Gemmatimonadaceae bacterium]|nr:UvrD-helicase domain-containing protein [Gemmatimonadaceae bacterium]
MLEPLAGLNPAQRDAVLHGEGPLLVLAGAGSGKTRVLTTRIFNLIREHGVEPSQILAVTFTNKAAGEMRARLARLLGGEPTGMWVGTFHSVGARLLRANAKYVNRTSAFTIYDEDDIVGTVKRLMDAKGLSVRDLPPKVVHSVISDAKNALVLPSEYAKLASDPLSRAAAQVYNDLERTMQQQNAVDFDDLLLLPVELFRAHPDRLQRYSTMFRYILVDEYQDTNRAQYMLIKLLGSHGNVAVVGDDDQSIYGWRGADIRNILDFEKDFPAARVVRLEENYRSTQPILDLANVVIEGNTQRLGKTLRTNRRGGERVVLVRAADERDEANFVVDQIVKRRLADRQLALKDFAILYRANAQSRAFEEALRRERTPYRVIGAVRFYDRREVRDVMSYLKLIANPADEEAFRRAITVPRRGVGEQALGLLSEAARGAGVSMLEAAARPDLVTALRPGPRTALAEFAVLLGTLREKAVDAGVDELLDAIVSSISYGDVIKSEPDAAERLENLRELIESAAETVIADGGEVGLRPLDHFLQRTSLVAAIDHLDPNADAVSMMTMHNAKGLEFPIVFITGLEDGLFPLRRAIDSPYTKELEEERRLFYVGITRAERTLYLTYADHRRWNGSIMEGIPSRFLKGIPKEMLEQHQTEAARSFGRSAFATFGQRDDRDPESYRPSLRRPGTPVSLARHGPTRFAEEADVSQDAPAYRVGERVKHKTFGSGVIAEMSGAGKELKVRVDFDNPDIGRKTLVAAQAGLERGWE